MSDHASSRALDGAATYLTWPGREEVVIPDDQIELAVATLSPEGEVVLIVPSLSDLPARRVYG